jgi:hypothetical protein
MQDNKGIKLKAYSPGELAEMYEVDGRTFNRWIEPFKEEIGERRGRYYNIAQVKTIFKRLCLPGYVAVE